MADKPRTPKAIMEAMEYRPWYTEPFIEWFETKLRGYHNVLEWGAGASTIWLAQRARTVTAIESEEAWYMAVSLELGARGLTRAQVIFVSTDVQADDWSQYAQAARKGLVDKYDVIILDGKTKSRRHCAPLVKSLLRPRGMIVLDNSDTVEHKNLFEHFGGDGRRRKDFSGPGYGSTRQWMTSAWS